MFHESKDFVQQFTRRRKPALPDGMLGEISYRMSGPLSDGRFAEAVDSWRTRVCRTQSPRRLVSTFRNLRDQQRRRQTVLKSQPERNRFLSARRLRGRVPEVVSDASKEVARQLHLPIRRANRHQLKRHRLNQPSSESPKPSPRQLSHRKQKLSNRRVPNCRNSRLRKPRSRTTKTTSTKTENCRRDRGGRARRI